MKHLGDITKISGYEVEPVDVIIGGSPCQDLPIAGNRNGLAGERSGLFMEQIRIVKEMRERDRNMGRTDDDVRPRWMCWENVPGAFSSNNKRDFQAVLTEIVRIAEPDAPDVPLPDKDGWAKCGVLYGEMGNWSIAYCVTDAQYWGTPQLRKRIALVADFNGLSAPDVLFDPKVRRTPPQAEPNKAVPDSGAQTGQSVQSVGTGLSGHSEPGGEAWEETAEATSGRTDGTGSQSRGGIEPSVCKGTESTGTSGRTESDEEKQIVTAGFSFGQSSKARGIGYQEECSPTLRGGDGGNQKPHIVTEATMPYENQS